MTDRPSRPGGLNRRKFLYGTVATTTLAASTKLFAPAVHAQEAVTLRYLGTAVNQSSEIAAKVKEDLGITIEYIPVTTDEVTRRVVTQPNTFDLVDIEYMSLKNVVPTGNLKGMDTSKIKQSNNISDAVHRGHHRRAAGRRPGHRTVEVIWLPGEDAKDFADEPTSFMSLDPHRLQCRYAGHPPGPHRPPDRELGRASEPEFKGKASILNIPSIGIMDAALVVEAMGKHTYKDKGNMTREEIDLTIDTLIEAKRAGQFRALWQDFNESVNLMASGEVVIQSMWSPAVTAVRTQGIDCVYQPLKEGYRAWAAGFGLPSTIEGRKLDAAYDFVNWFLSGWAGAFLNRQGYYSAVLSTAKENMEPYEWAYWMEGQPAEQDIMSPSGQLLAKAGTTRDGGSYQERMGAISCWNAVMDENVYMVRKWNEFVAS